MSRLDISNSQNKLIEDVETREDSRIEDDLMLNYSKSRNSLDSISQNKIPKKLIKTFYFSLSLFILGIILLSVGIEESIRKENFDSEISYFILSILLLIPGAYYMYQFYKAKNETNINERRDIFSDIPEL